MKDTTMRKHIKNRTGLPGALGTAFVYRPAWGAGEGSTFLAATAECVRSNYPSCEEAPVEVSSLAVAKRLIAILSTPAGEELRADYSIRERQNFLRGEVDRLNRIIDVRDTALRQANVALTNGNLERAAKLKEQSDDYAMFAEKTKKQNVLTRALLDQDSAESLAAKARRLALRKRLQTLRINHATKATA